MAYYYSIHPNLNLLYTKLEGFMSSEELVQVNYEISSDPTYRPGMRELTEMSGVMDTNVGFDWLSKHSDYSAQYYSAARRTECHLVASSDLSYGVARIYASVLESKVPSAELHIHRSDAEALAALGRPEKTIKELLSN